MRAQSDDQVYDLSFERMLEKNIDTELVNMNNIAL